MRQIRVQPIIRHAILFSAIVVALQLVGRQKMLQDPGTFWHTVVGERILASNSLPRTDWLSFTQDGTPWIAQQWLGELSMALVHRLSGLDGLLWTTSIMLAGIFAFLGIRLRDAGLAWRHVVLLLILAMAASSYHFLVRPHVFTMAAMTLVFSLLCDVESGRIPLARLWLLPPAFIVWVNVHGGVLGGLATVLFVTLGWIIWKRRPARDARSIVVIGAVCSLCIAAMLVNPYGAALPATWLRLMTSPVLPTMVVEHAPVNPFSFEGAMLGALAVVYLGCLYKACNRPLNLTWLVPLLWLPMAFSRIRHGPLFVITAVIAIAEMSPLVFVAQNVLPKLGGYIRSAVVCAGLFILGIVLQLSGANLPIVGRNWARISPDYWPTQSIAALGGVRPGNHPPRQ